MNIKRKILSFLLCLTMVFTMSIPFNPAYAQNDDGVSDDSIGRSASADVFWKIKVYDDVDSNDYVTVDKKAIDDDFVIKEAVEGSNGSEWYMVNTGNLDIEDGYCYVKAKDLKLDESKVTIECLQEAVLSVEADENATAYQWQVYVPSADIWANVYKETKPECTVSYTMLLGILNEKGQGVMRCRITAEDGVYYSSEAFISANENALEDAQEIENDNLNNSEDITSEPEENMDEIGEISIESDIEEIQNNEEAAEIIESAEEAENKMENHEVEETQSKSDSGVDNEEPEFSISVSSAKNLSEEIIESSNETEQEKIEKEDTDEGISESEEINEFEENIEESNVSDEESVTEADEADKESDENLVKAEEKTASLMADSDRYYNISYFVQGLDGKYSLLESESMSKKVAADGVTSVPTEADKIDIPGYVLVKYETANLDDEQIVEVNLYYDRKYVLVMFDVNGGVNCPEAIYAKYGTTIGAVSEPTKSEHKFIGWYSDKECTKKTTIAATVPKQNITYYAGWTLSNGFADVKVVYWRENADDDEYSYSQTKTISMPIGSTYTPSADMIYYECGKEEHTHTEACLEPGHVHNASCYTTQSALSSSDNLGDDNNKSRFQELLRQRTGDGTFRNGYIFQFRDINSTYYMYYDGNWYKITSSEFNSYHGDQIGEYYQPVSYIGFIYRLYSLKEKKPDSYICGLTEHTHSASTCTVSKEFEINTSKSDTITVTAGSSNICNVYLDRKEYTYTFGDGSDEDLYGSITAKCGAVIQDKYLEICSNVSGIIGDVKAVWYTDRENTETYMVTHMASENRNYTLKGTKVGVVPIYYWLQNIGAGSERNSTNYTLAYTSYASKDYDYTKAEDFINITGFTYSGNVSAGESISSNPDLYYTRNSYTLTLNDGKRDLSQTYSVQYGQSFSEVSGLKDFTPAKPEGILEGYNTFGGWYKNPECSDKHKVDLNNPSFTMPASDIVLYAKWLGDEKTINFYKSDSLADKLISEQKIAYGDKIKTLPTDEQRDSTKPEGDYVFMGWYYKDSKGVEHPYDINNMTVFDNVNIYPKWQSAEDSNLKTVAYTVYYKMEDKTSGNYVDVAAPVTGTAVVGNTKIFDPKKVEFYSQYKGKIRPITIDQKTMTIDSSAEKNVYIFFYEEKDKFTITYKIVAPPGCGTLDEKSEEVVEGGAAVGCTATEVSGVGTFVGWYSDKDCKTKADDSFTSENDGKTIKVTDVNVDATYYAKFTGNVSTLTVSKTGMKSGENAVFEIYKGTDTSPLTTVTVDGNGGSANVYGVVIGQKYTVKEVSGWSWDYDVSSENTKTVEIKANAADNKAEFTNASKSRGWLRAEFVKKNLFK